MVPLGEGSNVVIAGDLEALVLRVTMPGMEVVEDARDTVVVRVAAGENWHGLVQWSLRQGFSGLENLALIPGTVGAAPIQNIGAYGVELAPPGAPGALCCARRWHGAHAHRFPPAASATATASSSTACGTSWSSPRWSCS